MSGNWTAIRKEKWGFQYNIRAVKRDSETGWKFDLSDYGISCVDVAGQNFFGGVEKGFGWKSYMFTVYLTKYDPEKAKKIAQDMLYKKLAENAGL